MNGRQYVFYEILKPILYNIYIVIIKQLKELKSYHLMSYDSVQARTFIRLTF